MSFSSCPPLATSSPRLCRRRLSFDVDQVVNNRNSPSPTLAPANYGGMRMVLDEGVLEALKQLIDVYLSTNVEQQHQSMTPPSSSTIRWSVNDGRNLNYTVVITFNQPTAHLV